MDEVRSGLMAHSGSSSTSSGSSVLLSTSAAATPLAPPVYIQCPVAEACPGDAMPAVNTSAAYATLWHVTNMTRAMTAAQCIRGHVGPVCDTCATDWAKGPDGLCIECTGGRSSPWSVAVVIIVVTMVLVFLGLLVLFMRDTCRDVSKAMLAKKRALLNLKGATEAQLEQRSKVPQLAYLSFLFADYTRSCWWWELVEVARKALQ